MASNEGLFKEPWLAVNLSLLAPGVGQIYAGAKVIGAVILLVWSAAMGSAAWLAATAALPWYAPLAILALAVAAWAYSLPNAHRLARQANTKNMEQKRRSTKDPYLAAFLSRLLPGAGYLYLGRGGIALGVWMVTIALAAVGVLLGLGWVLFVVYPMYVAALCLLSWSAAPEGRRTQTTGILALCAAVGLLGVGVHAAALVAHRSHSAGRSESRIARDRVQVPAQLGNDPWEK